nr:WASP homolog-associated protein with actin, membranes and microtubules-like [Macaca fascicularis]
MSHSARPTVHFQMICWPRSFQSVTVSILALPLSKGVPLSEAGNVKSPKCQDCHGKVPVHVFVPVGDQTHSKSSEELSLPLPPPPPQPPPPPPSPPPLPPPPLPALSSSSQAAAHQNLGFRAPVKDDQPLPLVCQAPAGRPRDSLESFPCPGSTDEVLASLRHGRARLWKVEVLAVCPPHASVHEHILAAIRQGVKLKKVYPDIGPNPSSKPTTSRHTSDLERSIKAALQRIKRCLLTLRRTAMSRTLASGTVRLKFEKGTRHGRLE